MKDTLTELVFILDRSGSMAGLAKDTIGGFNSMIEEQKKEPGEAYVTTVLFDHEYRMLYDRTPLSEVKPLTDKEYFARGMTALLDAVGRTIDAVGVNLAAEPEEERPAKVIVVITTDGMENASREYSRERVKQMISHQQDKYNWNFIFLGANMNAVSEARSLGIDENFARNYVASQRGVERLYDGVSESMKTMRSLQFDRRVKNEAFGKSMECLNSIEDDEK